MILHILTDDKFADYAISQFGMAESEFVLILYNEEIRYVSLSYQAQICKVGSHEFEGLLVRLEKYTTIIFHGLFDPWCSTIIDAAPDNVKLAWVLWDGEVYSRPDTQKRFLAPKTKRLNDLHVLLNIIKYRSASKPYAVPKSYFKKMNYCLVDCEEEFTYAKRYFGGNFQQIWYSYYTIEETIGALQTCRCVKDGNILVGNSASVECNYLECFSKLRNHSIHHRVITPLSYGSPWIRNIVMRYGKTYFKEKFLGLKDFIPRNDYNILLCGCSCAIMGHWRPQAFGNIVTLLWLGARVYLSEKNPYLPYLRRLGVIVFSIDEDLGTGRFDSLTDKEMESNRQILLREYGVSAKSFRIKKIINLLNN